MQRRIQGGLGVNHHFFENPNEKIGPPKNSGYAPGHSKDVES